MMIAIDHSPEDDPGFVDLAQEAIAGVARLEGIGIVHVIHIDNWFGERWFGFAGKLLGAVGVHQQALQVPPFHPNRVLSEKRYELSKDGTRVEITPEPIHGHRSSESNTRLGQSIGRADQGFVIAWYSGNTFKNRTGSLMVYVCPQSSVPFGWYVGLEKGDAWNLKCRVNLSLQQWNHVLASGKAM